MIFTTLDDFYVSAEALADSPSRKDGVSQEVERNQRIYGCELIQEACILLKLPQAVMATGQVLLHRFYCKVSLVEHDIKKAAIACVWLATKLEESPRIMKQILSVFYRLDRRRQGKSLPPLDIYSMLYEKLRADIVNMERIILRAFGFILHVEHPHKFVLNYLMVLEQHKDSDSGVLQRAWNLANDSLRTTLCVQYKAETVACGLIFLAARQLKVPLPENPAWWELFSVKKSELLEVAVAVSNLYALPKAEYAPISKDALREQRHAAAAKQSAAPPSPQPEQTKSPLSASTGAEKPSGDVSQAADASGGGGGSDERPTSAGNASVAHQTNGHAKDDESDTSKGPKRSVSAVANSRKHHSSRSPSRSKSPIREDKKSRHQEGYREKHRDRSASASQNRSDPDAKKHRVIHYDPRLDRVSSSTRDRDRHRSHSHASKHRHRDDRDYSRDRSDRKRRRDDVSPEG